jgi:hypothetical protein
VASALVSCTVGALLASGCGSHSGNGTDAVGVRSGAPSSFDSQQAAERVCRAAFGEHVASAAATTLGAVRGWGIGPPPMDFPAASAFPAEPDNAFAAWCWVGAPPQFTSWAVDEHGVKVEFGSVRHLPGDKSTPFGPIGIGS